MKKSTVLIVLITFVISVVVVGVFGMQFKSYNTHVYVDKIEPLEVISSSSDKPILRQGENAGEWQIIAPYKKDTVINLRYEVTPQDATDASVKLTAAENDLVELDGFNIKMIKDIGTKVGTVQLRYRAQDGNNAEIKVKLYIVPKKIYDDFKNQNDQ